MKKTNFTLPGILLALAMMTPGQPAGAADASRHEAPKAASVFRLPDLFRSNLYAYSLTSGIEEMGLYNISLYGDMDLIWEAQVTDAYLFNGWMNNGRLCGLDIMSTEDAVQVLRYDEFDPETGELLSSLDLGADSWGGYFRQCTYIPEQNRIFGIGTDEKRWSCVKYLDMDDPTGEPVILTGINYTKYVYGICYNSSDKNIYAVTESNKFVRIDQETGEYEELMDIPLPKMRSNFAHGLVYLPTEDEYFFAASTNEWDTNLYRIDLAAGIIKEIGHTPNAEAISFMFSTDKVDPLAPVRAEFISNNFPAGSLTGSFSYRLPSELRGGSTASETLSWTLNIDGVKVCTGQGAPGSEISAPTTVSQGRHLLEMTVDNGSHRGPVLSTYVYVGNDTPKAPQNVVLVEGKVTWDAVSEGINDGYLNLNDLFYEVYINDKYIGETDGTELIFDVTDDTPCGKYVAKVFAICSDIESEAGVSNSALYGAPLPLDVKFTPTVAEGELFTNISAGGQYVTWSYQAGDESFQTSSPFAGPSVCQLVTPPLNFPDNEKVYSVSFDAMSIYDFGSDPKLYVTLIRAYDDSEPVKTIIQDVPLQQEGYKTYSETFTVPEAGKYYVSFNCLSEKWANRVGVKNIAISITDISAAAPTICTDIEAKGADNGELSADVTLTMPLTDLIGRDIPTDTNITATLKCGDNTASVTGTPGSVHTVGISTMQGNNEILITSSIGSDTGQTTSVNVYTGIDRPGMPQNVKVSMDGTNHVMTLEWEHPTEGADGHYFEPTGLSYRIYSRVGWSSFDLGTVTDGVTTFEYTFPESETMMQYPVYIIPSNEMGEGIQTSVIVTPGKPYTLPIDETFYNNQMQYSPVSLEYPSDEYRSAMMWIVPPYQVESVFDRYDHSAIIVFPGVMGESAALISFPKFSTLRDNSSDVDKTSVKATFEIWTGDMMANEITLLGQAFGMEEPVKIGKIEPAGDWSTVEFFLPDELMDQVWLTLMLDCKFADSPEYAALYTYSIDFTSETGVYTLDSSEGRIRANGSYLYLDNLQGESYTICTLDGKTVKAGMVNDSSLAIGLDAGIYVVRAADLTAKVAIK